MLLLEQVEVDRQTWTISTGSTCSRVSTNNHADHKEMETVEQVYILAPELEP